MHFNFDVSFSQVVIFITLLGLLVRIESFLTMFLFEHELLIADYCERKGLDIKNLPTRRIRTLFGYLRRG